MSTRRAQHIVWLLIALLGLRGLVPAGYMVEAKEGSLSFVVCGSGIYAAVAQMANGQHVGHGNDQSISAEHAHHQHHHHGQNGGSESGSSDHSICPFAMAATTASAPDLHVVPVSPVDVGPLEAEPSTPFVSFGPSRAQQSRAPPFFS